jgi:hypothetical protein
MTTIKTTAKSEVLDVELSPEELEAASGGWSISFFGHTVLTGSDVSAAASWAWHKVAP